MLPEEEMEGDFSDDETFINVPNNHSDDSMHTTNTGNVPEGHAIDGTKTDSTCSELNNSEEINEDDKPALNEEEITLISKADTYQTNSNTNDHKQDTFVTNTQIQARRLATICVNSYSSPKSEQDFVSLYQNGAQKYADVAKLDKQYNIANDDINATVDGGKSNVSDNIRNIIINQHANDKIGKFITPNTCAQSTPCKTDIQHDVKPGMVFNDLNGEGINQEMYMNINDANGICEDDKFSLKSDEVFYNENYDSTEDEWEEISVDDEILEKIKAFKKDGTHLEIDILNSRAFGRNYPSDFENDESDATRDDTEQDKETLAQSNDSTNSSENADVDYSDDNESEIPNDTDSDISYTQEDSSIKSSSGSIKSSLNPDNSSYKSSDTDIRSTGCKADECNEDSLSCNTHLENGVHMISRSKEHVKYEHDFDEDSVTTHDEDTHLSVKHHDSKLISKYSVSRFDTIVDKNSQRVKSCSVSNTSMHSGSFNSTASYPDDFDTLSNGHPHENDTPENELKTKQIDEDNLNKVIDTPLEQIQYKKLEQKCSSRSSNMITESTVLSVITPSNIVIDEDRANVTSGASGLLAERPDTSKSKNIPLTKVDKTDSIDHCGNVNIQSLSCESKVSNTTTHLKTEDERTNAKRNKSIPTTNPKYENISKSKTNRLNERSPTKSIKSSACSRKADDIKPSNSHYTNGSSFSLNSDKISLKSERSQKLPDISSPLSHHKPYAMKARPDHIAIKRNECSCSETLKIARPTAPEHARDIKAFTRSRSHHLKNRHESVDTKNRPISGQSLLSRRSKMSNISFKSNNSRASPNVRNATSLSKLSSSKPNSQTDTNIATKKANTKEIVTVLKPENTTTKTDIKEIEVHFKLHKSEAKLHITDKKYNTSEDSNNQNIDSKVKDDKTETFQQLTKENLEMGPNITLNNRNNHSHKAAKPKNINDLNVEIIAIHNRSLSSINKGSSNTSAGHFHRNDECKVENDTKKINGDSNTNETAKLLSATSSCGDINSKSVNNKSKENSERSDKGSQGIEVNVNELLNTDIVTNADCSTSKYIDDNAHILLKQVTSPRCDVRDENTQNNADRGIVELEKEMDATECATNGYESTKEIEKNIKIESGGTDMTAKSAVFKENSEQEKSTTNVALDYESGHEPSDTIEIKDVSVKDHVNENIIDSEQESGHQPSDTIEDDCVKYHNNEDNTGAEQESGHEPSDNIEIKDVTAKSHVHEHNIDSEQESKHAKNEQRSQKGTALGNEFNSLKDGIKESEDNADKNDNKIKSTNVKKSHSNSNDSVDDNLSTTNQYGSENRTVSKHQQVIPSQESVSSKIEFEPVITSHDCTQHIVKTINIDKNTTKTSLLPESSLVGNYDIKMSNETDFKTKESSNKIGRKQLCSNENHLDNDQIDVPGSKSVRVMSHSRNGKPLKKDPTYANMYQKKLLHSSPTGKPHFSEKQNLEKDKPSPITNSKLKMSGKLTKRNSSGLADLARLQDIRRELHLTEKENVDSNGCDNYQIQREMIKRETLSIINDILDDVMKTSEEKSATTAVAEEVKVHRCTTKDDDGNVVLCCQLQTSSNTVDPSQFTCDVIDPLDVIPVTKQHERLISHIVKISGKNGNRLTNKTKLMAQIPIAHYYVEPWQEVLIKAMNRQGRWPELADAVDIIKIDDGKKVFYGVQVKVRYLNCIAVVTRPKITVVTLGPQAMVVPSVSDERVKMHVFENYENDEIPKQISLQVVPVDKNTLTEFQDTFSKDNVAVITAASPLVVIHVNGLTPESVKFTVPYVSSIPEEDNQDGINSPSPAAQTQNKKESIPHLSLTPGILPPPSSKQLAPAFRKLLEISNEIERHLVQINGSDIRVKLLENAENDTGKPQDDDDGVMKFSVYDKSVSLQALETKGVMQYYQVQNLAKTFVEHITMHKVRLCIKQDTRNIYAINVSATVDLPHRQFEKKSNQLDDSSTTNEFIKELKLVEGDAVAILFRGNIRVINDKQKVYSFHGYRGINRLFDIQVSSPYSQRSLKNYQGKIEVFTLRGPRMLPLNKTATPMVRDDWELRAEYKLIIPKYLKKTPIIINKAPILIRFQEPLTVDFIRLICTETVNEWATFATALGVSNARVQAIKQHNRHVISERVLMDIIVCWMKKQPIASDKVEPLLNALNMCNKEKLSAELSQRYQSMHSTRSATAKDKQLLKAISLTCKSKIVTARWRQLFAQLCRADEKHNQIADDTKEIDQTNENEATKCFSALCHWKTLSKSASVWMLIDALRSCNCKVAADTLMIQEFKRV